MLQTTKSSGQQQPSYRGGCLCYRLPNLQDSSNHLTEGVVCATDYQIFRTAATILQRGLFVLQTTKSSGQQQPSYRGGCLCYRLPNLQDSSNHLTEGVVCATDYQIFRTAATILQRRLFVLQTTMSSGQQQPSYRGGCLCYRLPNLQDSSNHLTEGVVCATDYQIFRTAATILQRRLFVLQTTMSSGQQQPSYRGGCLCYILPNLQDCNNHLIEGFLCAMDYQIFRTAATI